MILFYIVNQGRAGIRYDASRVFASFMGRVDASTISRRSQVHGENRPWRPVLYPVNSRCHRESGSMDTWIFRNCNLMQFIYMALLTNPICSIEVGNDLRRRERLGRLYPGSLFGNFFRKYVLYMQNLRRNADDLRNYTILVANWSWGQVSSAEVEVISSIESDGKFLLPDITGSRNPYSAYTYEKDEFLVLQARIHGSIQKVVLKTLQATMIYWSHYPLMALNPGASRIYENIRAYLYCPHISNEFSPR